MDEGFIELSHEEVVLGFVASGIEFVAAALKRPFDEVYRRMLKAGLIRDYLYKCYEAVHCDSRENVTAELIEALARREGNSR